MNSTCCAAKMDIETAKMSKDGYRNKSTIHCQFCTLVLLTIMNFSGDTKGKQKKNSIE